MAIKKILIVLFLLSSFLGYSQSEKNFKVRNKLTVDGSIEYLDSTITGWNSGFIPDTNKVISLIAANPPAAAGLTNGDIQLYNNGVLGYSSNFAFNDTILKLKSLSTNVIIGDTINTSISGSDNLLVGVDAGVNNTTGSRNVYLGRKSGFDAEIANNNVFIGYQSGFNTTNSNATAIGYDTDVGTNSVSLGYQAGRLQTSGASNNVFLGYQSGQNNISGTNNIFLGYQGGKNETGSNKLYIEASDASNPLIYGEFDNDKLRFNADTSTFVGHEKVDSNLYVQGSIISLNKVYASAYLPKDSATVTTATLGSTYYFVKGNFLNSIGRGTDFAGDTLYINRPNVDSVLIEYRHTARITSSKSATIRAGFSDNGAAISGTTKSSSFGAGSSQSITHFGTLWVKDNDPIKYVVESSAAANNITFQEVSLIIEEKYTSENYNK